MDPVKVAGVAEWPVPKNKKEVQQFLGFTNFYRRFIQDFSHYACAMFDLTGANVPFKWDMEQQTAFDKLQESITSTPVLTFADDSKPFRVEADSSDFATGAVLYLRQGNASHYTCIRGMATFPGRSPAQDRDLD
jgi:hypothetical protein